MLDDPRSLAMDFLDPLNHVVRPLFPFLVEMCKDNRYPILLIDFLPVNVIKTLMSPRARRPLFLNRGGIAPISKWWLLSHREDVHVAESMQRAILLQTDATRRKAAILKEFSDEATYVANYLLRRRRSKHPMDFHREAHQACKEATGFNSQVICDIERSVARSKGKTVKTITVKFNVPRNCRTFNTKSRFFVEFGLYPGRRVAVPLQENENLRRYTSLVRAGWACKTYGLTSGGGIVAFLSKEEEALPMRQSVVGVDVNSKCFAATLLTQDGRVLKQLYFGKDIWVRRKKIMLRRERLQSLADQGSHRARRSLHSVNTKEGNFVRNRVGEVVRDITNLAKKFEAGIAVEALTRFAPKGKKYNREVLRMPFNLFKRNLEARCLDKDIDLKDLDPWHTSKWCSHCGALAASGHSSKNYAIFKCPCCGQVVNSDRKASLAVAVKSLLVRRKNEETSERRDFFQFTSRPVPVNGLLRSDEGAGFGAVRHMPAPMESHLFQ
nr:zinc ribbon domain-containing protein [Candidatus Njordarchaeota archaeon]